MKKPINIALLSVSALLGLAACTSNEPSSSVSSKEESNSSVASSSTNTSEEPVLEVTVSIVAPASNKITVGDELQLQAKVENAKPSDTLIWKSSNNDVLSVDNTGKIKGISKGEAQIRASIAGKTSEPITITVEAKIDSTAYPRFLKYSPMPKQKIHPRYLNSHYPFKMMNIIINKTKILKNGKTLSIVQMERLGTHLSIRNLRPALKPLKLIKGRKISKPFINMALPIIVLWMS